jgi:hypothetical protein
LQGLRLALARITSTRLPLLEWQAARYWVLGAILPPLPPLLFVRLAVLLVPLRLLNPSVRSSHFVYQTEDEKKRSRKQQHKYNP